MNLKWVLYSEETPIAEEAWDVRGSGVPLRVLWERIAEDFPFAVSYAGATEHACLLALKPGYSIRKVTSDE